MWLLEIMEGLFPMDVSRGMVQMYETLLHTLCCDAESWGKSVSELLPTPTPAMPIAPPRALDERLMHELFLEQRERSADAVAVVAAGAGSSRELTYGEMGTRSEAVAACVLSCVQCGEQSPPVVAVMTSKGWEQVVAVLGVLLAGCAYLPINAQQLPQQRVEQILSLSGAAAVVVDGATLGEKDWLHHVGLPLVDASSAGDVGNVAESAPRVRRHPRALAYLIYTSGSTGVPKGVCCHHQGAVNTLLDLNERFGVGPADRVLALSSLSFDLSVYDVFGLLGAGASLVVPPHDVVSPPDPERWLELVCSQRVTVWNTVPAFMELLVAHAEQARLRLPSCLRLVFMSGDWIPRSLPARMRALSDCAELRIVSMGGATEAAIWSNMYELPQDDDLGATWKSIPYGRPLRNQTMLVLDENMEHCEPWVTGVIYIGGAGVALGYHGDERQTARQFVMHEGEMLFRTGDLGRLRPDGNLEILGREDSQVKVSGFRVELGEIEELLTSHDLVKAAVAQAYNGVLAAYVVFEGDQELEEGGALTSLRLLCAERLPSYMMPRYWMSLDEVPLSGNGKVARNRLPPPTDASRATSAADARIEPASELEEQVRAAMGGVLRVPAASLCCVASNFFELGGDSVSALRLLATLRASFGSLSVQQLFANPTVQGICQELRPSATEENALAGAPSQRQLRLICLQRGDPSGTPLFLVHPAGATSLCYLPLSRKLGAHQPVYAFDDHFLSGECAFTFTSISAVAGECLELIREVAPALATSEVALGGWSYGGVVALEMAKRAAELPPLPFSVRTVVMLDAPLGQTAGRGFFRDGAAGAASLVGTLRGQLALHIEDEETLESLTAHAAQHFARCNQLLDTYTPPTGLRVPIVDIRPRASECRFIGSLATLTSGTVDECDVPGDHWSMLFGENTSAVSYALAPFLPSEAV